MVAFSPGQAAVADGSSATSTPTCFTPVGVLVLEVDERPLLPAALQGEGAGEVGVACWLSCSAVTVTSGICGFLAITLPPDVAVTEKLPTSAKALVRSDCTSWALAVPL